MKRGAGTRSKIDDYLPSSKRLFLDIVMADPALPGSAKSAAYFLLDHLNTRTERCDPSWIGLSERMGVSRRSAIAGIAALISRGSFGRVAGGGRGIRTTYRPCWERVKAASLYQDSETVKQNVVNGEAERPETVKQNVVNGEADCSRNREEAGNRNREETKKENSPSADSILASPDEPETPAPAKTKYAFEGRVARLTHADFDRWQKSYRHIDLRGALQSRDDWLAELPEDDRRRTPSGWYRPTSNWLASLNEKASTEARRDTADSDTIY